LNYPGEGKRNWGTEEWVGKTVVPPVGRAEKKKGKGDATVEKEEGTKKGRP